MVAYGETMLAVQTFELGLKGFSFAATVDDRDDEVDFDEAWRRFTKNHLSKAAGRLRMPDGARDRIVEAMRGRNVLAHEFLLTYRMRAAESGEADAHRFAIDALAKARQDFLELTEWLDEATAVLHDELGWVD